MSSANEFLFSSRFSFAGEVSGLAPSSACGTVPRDFAISSTPAMPWSGPSSGTALPLHAGPVGAAGASSVMLRVVPGWARLGQAVPGCAQLLPRGGSCSSPRCPGGLLPCESGPGAAPVPSPQHPLRPGLAQHLPRGRGSARCIIKCTIIIYINKQSEARELLCWPESGAVGMSARGNEQQFVLRAQRLFVSPPGTGTAIVRTPNPRRVSTFPSAGT